MRLKHKEDTGTDYWKTYADVLSAVLLTVILFAIILLLYIDSGLNNNSSNNNNNIAEVTTTGSVQDQTTTVAETKQQSDGGQEETTTVEEITTDNGQKTKTAIRVKVIDQDTKKLIRKKGIKFSLYTKDGAKVTLHTYYPKKKAYDVFETDSEGCFFLPEKIETGNYYFKQLNDVTGYDKNNRSNFTAVKIHDWSAPDEVRIVIGPSQNSILISQYDLDTNTIVSGGKYQIIAAENIETLDGTLRYSTGQIVDQINLNRNGVGKSKKLYLGKYQIKQIYSPQYYSILSEVKGVRVKSKNSVGETVNCNIKISKTKYIIKVCDELEKTKVLKQATFVIRKGANEEKKNISSDETGTIVLEQLEKNTTYSFNQIKSEENYNISEKTFSFKVDKYGQIEKKSEKEMKIYNRIIRTSISVNDYLLGTALSNYHIVVNDQNNSFVEEWTSDGSPHTIEGIATGTYKIIVKGPFGKTKILSIKDTAEIQKSNIRVITWLDILIIVVSAIIVFIILIVLFKKRNKIKEIIKVKKEGRAKYKELKKVKKDNRK